MATRPVFHRFSAMMLCMTVLCASRQERAAAQVGDDEMARVREALPKKAAVRPKKRRKLLIFNLCKGFVHDSIPIASKALVAMGEETGAYSSVESVDIDQFKPENLKQYDAVCFNNTTGTLFQDEARKKAFLDFVSSGKGVIGIHAATDCFYDWHEYGAMMGGYFDGHPWHEKVPVQVVEPRHPLCAAFGGEDFEITDEIYQFKDPYSRDVLRVLLRLDPERIDQAKNSVKRRDNDFAISWVREYGQGRVFYCSLGHRKEIFWTPTVLKHYLDGIQFAMGDLEADASARPWTALDQVDTITGNYAGTLERGGKSVQVQGKVFPMPGRDTYHCALYFEGKRVVLTSGFVGLGDPLPIYASREAADKGGETSVEYAYYEGDWDKLPEFSSLTPVKEGVVGNIDLSVRERDDYFAIRFTGVLPIPEKGRYLFALQSDDGSRLQIGRDVVIDHDGLHGAEKKTGEITLMKGTYPITISFFEKNGGEELSVGYAKHTQPLGEPSEGLLLRGEWEGCLWEGSLTEGTLTAKAALPGKGSLELKKTSLTSPTAGKKPPKDAAVLLPLKEDEAPSLAAWTNPTWLSLPDGSMRVGKSDNRTRERFGDCHLHIEFMTPYQPNDTGQGRGNSGVYLMDRYEVQVLDSFGLVPRMGDCGAIYGVAVPKVNACLPPLTWQTYDIDFKAPRVDKTGNVKEMPSMTVYHNGTLIHENQTIPNATTAAGQSGHAAKGPLKLQDHGNPVRYRNIWLVEK